MSNEQLVGKELFQFIPLPYNLSEEHYRIWFDQYLAFQESEFPAMISLQGELGTVGQEKMVGNQKLLESLGIESLEFTFNELLLSVIREDSEKNPGVDISPKPKINRIRDDEPLNAALEIETPNGIATLKLRITAYSFNGDKIGQYIEVTEVKTHQDMQNDMSLKSMEMSLLSQEALTKAQQEINELIALVISGLTHDAKTPLSTIVTSAFLVGRILKESINNIDSAVLTKLDKITQQALLVSRMIDEANRELISTTEFDKEMEYIDFRKEVSDLVATFNDLKELIRPKGSEVIIQTYFRNVPNNFKLFTNKQGFLRILENLIGNAIKYSQENSKAVIKVRFEIVGDYLEIQIEDNGIGIPGTFIDKIFKQYARAENVGRETKGTGVGLMIVKKFVDIMHGEITYQSTENVGTTFTIKLPVNLEKKKSGFKILAES